MQSSYPEIRLSKCKQHGKSFLTFRVGISHSDLRNVKYFTIQLKSNRAALSFSENAPNEAWTENAQSAAVIRKRLNTALLIAYVKTEKHDQLVLKSDGKLWLLEIDYSEAPTLSLIDQAGKNYFRWSNSATFTKPKQLEKFIFPTFEENNSLQSLFDFSEKNSPPPKQQELNFSEMQRTIRDKLARQVKTLKKALGKQQHHTSKAESSDFFKKQAQFLQDHLHLVKEGDLELKFDDQMIELNPDLSPGENVNALFIKAKKMERGLKEGSTRLDKISSELHNAEQALTELRARTFNLEELNTLAQKFKISLEKTEKVQSSSTKDERTFREFRSSDGSSLYLGRSAKENDLLTKRARSDDYWFHAVNASGSHVIVPKKKLGKNFELTSQTIREACILAIHFSKLSHAQSGEVYLTTRGNLRKQKGMPDGLWQVLKCETLKIKYEKAELDAIFAR